MPCLCGGRHPECLRSKACQRASGRARWRTGASLASPPQRGAVGVAVTRVRAVPRCTPTTLALLNEPGPGGDVNVGVAVEGAEVVFSAERAVRRGEELYLDYGQDYDRSGYGGGA